jgi:hypothetical protein
MPKDIDIQSFRDKAADLRRRARDGAVGTSELYILADAYEELALELQRIIPALEQSGHGTSR